MTLIDFQIAARNLLKHTKRNLLLGGAIAAVTALLVVMGALTQGIRSAMLESATTLMTGHVNVGGFFKITSGTSAPLVTDFEKVLAETRRLVPELDYVTARGRGWAKAVSERSSMDLVLAGVDIAREPGFRRVVRVKEGSLEDLAKPGAILLFEDQAKRLEVRIGDAITLSAPTARGINNTAVGINALTANTFGNNNAAVGSFALSANTGGLGNTALGRSALAANLTGNNNAAVGLQALLNNTGSNNVAIGSQAGLSATTGNNNIYIGHFGVAAEGNTIRIGTSGTQAATFMAGITGVSVTGSAVMVDGNGQLGVTVSTQRAKEDIRDMGEASEGLLRLRPVTFRYRQPSSDGSKPLQYGLIAEEVAEVMPELVVYDKDGLPQTVQYHVLPALLLNELQRQQAKLQQQQGELAELRARLEKQDAELAELKAALRTTLAQRQP